MPIVRTARAEADIVDIWTYIASSNPSAADRVHDELERKTELIGRYPEIGRERSDIAVGVRYVVCGSYLILYRFNADRIEIIRYVHGHRDLSRTV